MCRAVLPLAAGVALALGACERAPAPARSVATDDFGDTIAVAASPQRIVSLNPTTTELLYAIGAGGRLVGRTTYDRIPAAVLSVPDLGPGLRPNVEAVLAARPDLVILYASQDNRDAALDDERYASERAALKARLSTALAAESGTP